MNLQFALKLLLASSVAACCVTTAQAQIVDSEVTATVSSLQGSGWASGSLGQPVTMDFTYDFSQVTESLNNNVLSFSWPILSASIFGGPFGNGTDLESDGPGSGTFAAGEDLVTQATTQTMVTSGLAPSKGFTGDVFGASFSSDGVSATFDVVRNAFFKGKPDAADSGEVVLSNPTLTTGTAQAPEVDPSFAVSAMSLLFGGLAIIRGKKFAKIPAA